MPSDLTDHSKRYSHCDNQRRSSLRLHSGVYAMYSHEPKFRLSNTACKKLLGLVRHYGNTVDDITCQRCSGMMMRHEIYDWEDNYRQTPAWRCVNCGEVVDALILQHRPNGNVPRRRRILHQTPLQM